MSSRTQTRGKKTTSWLVVCAFVLQIFFFAPIQVLLQNFGEFSVRFADVLAILLVLSLALVVLLKLATRVFRFPAFLSFLTFLSAIAFLESRFFLNFAGHHPFDGKPIEWATFAWLSYLELGAVLALGGLFWVFRSKTQFLSGVSLFILLFLTAGLINLTTNNFGVLFPERQVVNEDSLYLDQFYRISDKRNVIHIVPDQTQGAMLHEILSSDYEHYSRVFDGFTLFTQSMGRYKGTYPSLLYYMTGESPEPEFDLVLNQPFTWDYIEETLKERSIVTLLSQNNFHTFGFQFHPGIFCKGPYTACTGTHDEVFAGSPVESPADKLAFTVLSALDFGLFQVTPIVFRQRLYDEGRWRVRKLAKRGVTHSGILDKFTDNMQVEDIPGSYNYFHHAGAHAPLLFDSECAYIGPQPVIWKNQREQVKCTLLQLEKMIKTLKLKNVYDQTMIVINGDHGTPGLPSSYSARSGELISSNLMGMASTLLLIKPPEVRGPLGFSSQAVTMGDIPATIADAFDLESTYTGVPMFTEEASADRERHYYTYDSSSKAHSLQALPNMLRYRIRGNVFDERDWVLPGTASVGKYESRLPMGHAEFLSHAQGFSILEQHNVPRRWVDGTHAKVFLSPPPQGSVALMFVCYVPESIVGQWMEISVDDKIVARLDDEELTKERHVIPLADDLSRKEVLEIEFTMGKTLDSSKDSRDLSVLFTYIGLQSTD